ncbi:MAG: carboxylesterase/lipase family protein [Rhodococcus sp.]|uniref:carboxylesterase/lipase family protein n=1 Tax=Rhodococcus sp. TaxID=1831 RepID=UPI00168F8A97|nr:carboxylesterase/lipase family protein [Rhodococcus sp. (in: high G+C Gram-positive bacteria)]NLV77929.1 carboxylesterase/lipase family protein [Rhodococcus sp. (in: high G+C Gram-positive bacteria)]
MDAETLVVDCKYGQARGYRDGATYVWKGIPYAGSTAGDGRFRSPEAPEPWNGVLDCARYGPIAPQSPDGPIAITPDMTPGEDCLSLNIWAPEPDGELRPVLVWIHGGAYVLGYSGQKIYDGRHLCETGDVVVVTVNYRLGALGFLDLSSLSTADCTFESNLGLRDQIAALEWVRDCITAFGGDPADVTLFGESSGGGSVTTLLTVPRAEGLFHRAIAQSPPATSVYGSERAATVAERFLEILDVPRVAVATLRSLPYEQLVAAGETLVGEIPTRVPGTLAMAPVVDRDLVPKYPVAAFQKGLSHRVPLIIGSNRDEPSIFRFMNSPLMPVDATAVHAMLEALASDRPDLDPERLAEIVAAYPDLPKASGAMALSRDAAFRMPVLWVAEAHARHSPTWVYRFDHATPILKATRLGAAHATELPYVFGNFGTLGRDPTFWLGGRKGASEVAGRVQRRWLAFARHGVPAALDGSRHWPPYEPGDRLTLLIDGRDTVVADPDREMRQVWGDRVMGFT